MAEYTFKIDLNVLNHLGLGLYSSTPAVLTEIIANAYDAEATEVIINIDKQNNKISIMDNGHGMSSNDLQEKFLNVGYARRNHSDHTLNKKRRVMGRKGIGKLAMFSLANVVNISTKQIGNPVIGIGVDVAQLKTTINKNELYKLQPINPSSKLTSPEGTVIELSDLNKSIISTTESNLKQRLARRFSVLDSNNNLPFNITIDGQKVTIADRGFHDDVQFFWSFGGQEAGDNLALCRNIAQDRDTTEKRITTLDEAVLGDVNLLIRGYIASVTKPRQLKGQDNTNINQISIFANGRVFQEDVLPVLNNSDHFNSYLVGEIHADFLDQDEIDRATASREAIKQNDPKFMALLGHLRGQMKKVADNWDEWRAVGYENLEDKNPFIEEWLNSLADERDRKSANKLIMSVYNNQFSSNEKQNDDYKKDLYRSTIIGFEKLKAKKQLARLDAISSVTSPEFQAIFRSLDDMEETYYWDITSGRLQVINKFIKIVDAKELEKVAQQYLFDHLWLLDPTWDRVKGTEQMELTLTQYLKGKCPDSTGARLDIAYRNSAGRQIIIELKRPGKTNIKFHDLLEQADKYNTAITEYLRLHPDIYSGSGLAPVDICLLLEEDIIKEEKHRRMLNEAQARIITYRGLIHNAQRIYQDYINANHKASEIDQLVQKI